MEEIYAVITGGVVTNTIVADEKFADGKPNIIRIDQMSPRPGIGWKYLKGEFIPPAQ